MSSHTPNIASSRRLSRSSGSQVTNRPSRVEKSRSHHNSPRATERRRTTTESKLYATLDDHFKMMFGIAPEEVIDDRSHPARPLSWHPSSRQGHTSQPTNYFEPMPQRDWTPHCSPSPGQSTRGDYYSLSTRNSMYDQIPSGLVASGIHRGSDESDASWLNAQHTPGYVHSALNTPTTEPLPWYLQQWAQKNQAQVSNTQSRSADFLPIQNPAENEQDMEDDGEKLVALGLYDTPEASLSWGLMEGTGKGLKLEETWQPPEDDDEEDADDASSEASVEEPSPILPQQTQPLQMPVQVKPTADSMEGQSFYFDEEDAAKDWWYQQIKQSSLPVQDAGMGFNWLRT